MIEPPKLYSEARKKYDMLDIEILGKLALDLNLQTESSVRHSFEKLAECAGCKNFGFEYTILYEYVMQKKNFPNSNNYYNSMYNGFSQVNGKSNRMMVAERKMRNRNPFIRSGSYLETSKNNFDPMHEDILQKETMHPLGTAWGLSGSHETLSNLFSTYSQYFNFDNTGDHIPASSSREFLFCSSIEHNDSELSIALKESQIFGSSSKKNS